MTYRNYNSKEITKPYDFLSPKNVLTPVKQDLPTTSSATGDLATYRKAISELSNRNKLEQDFQNWYSNYVVGLDDLGEQVQKARTNVGVKQTAAKDAYKVYQAFLDQQTNADHYSILDDDGAASAAAEQERKKLWTSYQQANDVALEAQALYEKTLETYTSRMATAERDGYYAMDLGELKTLLDSKKNDVDAKYLVAAAAQNDYGAFLDQPVTGNFLEEDMSPTEAMQAQQKSLLQASVNARDSLNEAIETYELVEDVYNERNDMQTISGMTETEKIALEIYSNDIDIIANLQLIKALSKEQRAQLRSTEKLFQILTDPKKYLRNAGYAENDIPRLAETYGRYLNAEDMQQLQQMTKAFAQEHPIFHTLGTYPIKAIGDVTGGLTALGSTIWHDIGFSNYNSIDVNSPGYLPMVYTDTVRETVSDNIPGEGSVLYDGFNNMADSMLTSAVAGKTGSAIIDSLGAFGSTARDTSIKGGTNEDALLMSTANAGLELLLNNLPVDYLLKTTTSEKWKQLIDIGISGAENMIREELLFIGDLAAQAAFLAEDSDFEMQVAALMQTGMSEEEAKRKYIKGFTRKPAMLQSSPCSQTTGLNDP